MSFHTSEIGVFIGRPVRLYEFTRGTFSWTYCGADREIRFQSRVWRPLPISDDGVRLTGETSADAVKVEAPADLEVAQLFRGAPPSAEISVVLRDYHAGLADLAASARVVFVGSVSGVRWPSTDRAEITCESLTASMERSGLRMAWDRACPHTIYDHNCTLNRDLYAVPAVVQSLDGATISSGTFDAYADGYFAGGFVRWDIGGGQFEQRGVETHVGSTLAILGGTDGLLLGQDVTAYPGCEQTDTYCQTVFGNGPNFGGFRHMPGKSPFDGNPIA